MNISDLFVFVQSDLFVILSHLIILFVKPLA